MKKQIVWLVFILLFLSACANSNSTVNKKTNVEKKEGDETLQIKIEQKNDANYFTNKNYFTLKTPLAFGDISVKKSNLTHPEALLPIFDFERKDGVKFFANNSAQIVFYVPQKHRDKNLTIVQVLEMNHDLVFRKIPSKLSDDKTMITATLEHFSNYTITQDRYGGIQIPDEVKTKLVEISKNPPNGAVEFYGKITYISNNTGRSDWEAFSVHKGCKAKNEGKWEDETLNVTTSEHDGDCVYDPVTDRQTCERGNALTETWRISFQWGYDLSPNANCNEYDGEIEFEDQGGNNYLGHFMAYTNEAKGKFNVMIDDNVAETQENFIGEVEGNIYGQGEIVYDLKKRPNVQIALAELNGQSLTGIKEGLYIEGKTNYNDGNAEKLKLNLKIEGVPTMTERIFGSQLAVNSLIPQYIDINKDSFFGEKCHSFGGDASKAEKNKVEVCKELTYSDVLQFAQTSMMGEEKEVFVFTMPDDNAKWKEFPSKHDGITTIMIRVKLTKKERPDPEKMKEKLKINPEEIYTQNTGGDMSYTNLCGNGTLEANEECDDANLENGDGCSSECQREISTDMQNVAKIVPDFVNMENGFYRFDESRLNDVVNYYLCGNIAQDTNMEVRFDDVWEDAEVRPGCNGVYGNDNFSVDNPAFIAKNNQMEIYVFDPIEQQAYLVTIYIDHLEIKPIPFEQIGQFGFMY